MAEKTFYVESGDKNISSNDVEFREYAEYIKESLRLSGAEETYDKKGADMCILVNYGISDESYTETVPVPIWGQTGVSSIRTTSKTTGSASGSAHGSASRIGNSIYGSAYGSTSGSSTTTATTNVTPSYGITGYTNVDRRVSLFRRVVNVYAYDNQQTSEPVMLWKTNLISEGSSIDLRRVVPYMAYIAWGRMGKSTGEMKEYKVYENDYFFLCWKQGMLTNRNITAYPIYRSSNAAHSNFDITIVEKTDDETIVVMRKDGCITTWYNILPSMCIECNGQQYYIHSVDHYTLGKKIYNECGIRYFRMHFPAIPSNVHNINIREDEVKPFIKSTRYSINKKGFEWIGLLIK
ncbi:MAG: hypothetical protein LBS54_06880 [Dysgonamonadaceae bacterium]|nr:hypothetical protein [Dysgonamonadaceae bacterium]